MNKTRMFLILLASCCIFGYGGYYYAGRKMQQKYDKDLEDMRETLEMRAKAEALLEVEATSTEIDKNSGISDEEFEEVMKMLRNTEVYMVTSDEKMNVRKEPSTQAEILGQLGRGNGVLATGEKTEDQKWAHIIWSVEDKQEGWLYIGGSATRHLEGNAVEVLADIGLYYKDVANQSISAQNQAIEERDQIVEEANDKLDVASSGIQKLSDTAQEIYEKYLSLSEKYDATIADYNALVEQYNNGQEKYSALLTKYNNLVDQYNQLGAAYEAAFAQ